MTRIPPYVARNRRKAACSRAVARRGPLALAFGIAVLVLVSSLAVVAGSLFVSTDTSTDAANQPPSTSAVTRDMLKWPFRKDSIWNLPIGANAQYVHAGLRRATAYGMTTDVDVLILTPTAPVTPVYYNDDAWNVVPGRCNAEGGVMFHAPIPSNFVVPGNGNGLPGHGTTPNYATAILAQDGVTLYQGQPFARCSSGGTATIWWYQAKERLDGLGNSGAHGGSMLSSIGGTIRLGELVPGGVIPHAMKLNLDGVNYHNGSGGFRWPATAKDSCAPGCYRGSVPAMRMGSLLALKPNFDLGTLETEAAKIVARAFIDYGAYAADNAGWSVYGIDTEYSPEGDVMVEFEREWGFLLHEPSRSTPWARDMDDIFLALHVVDNWDQAVWTAVSASAGALGVGLGVPRVPWAPDIGGVVPPPVDSIAPVTTASLSGTPGTADWFRSPVRLALTATDTGTGVAAINVRKDGGAWGLYSGPMNVLGEGSHTVEFYSTDIAGNSGPVQATTFRIDSVAPTTTFQVGGTSAADGSYIHVADVALAATDGMSGLAMSRYRIDGGAWQTYTTSFAVRGNGRHMVDYASEDIAGNAEAPESRTFTIIGDSHPIPESTMSSDGAAGANGWHTSRVTVTLSATGQGPTWITFRLDDDRWRTYSGPITVSEGRHVLVYQASDADGYVEIAKTAVFNVDSLAPVVTKVSPSGEDLPADRAVSWRALDAVSGVVGYRIGIDGGPFQEMGLETTLAQPWSAGAHVVVVKAFDAAGNEGTITIPFHVSGNPPTTVASPSVFAPQVSPEAAALLLLALPFMVVALVVLGFTAADGVHTRGPFRPAPDGVSRWEKQVFARLEKKVFSPLGRRFRLRRRPPSGEP